MIEEFSARSRRPLHLAVIQGDLDLVKKQIEEEGADVNEVDDWGKLALGYAAYFEHKEIVEFLLMYGADINGRDVDPEYFPEGKILDGMEDGWGAVHYLADAGKLEMLQFMIEKGADINLIDKRYGLSPLFLATFNDHYEVVQALIDAGADWNFRDKDGETVFHATAARGKPARVEMLLDMGAGIEMKDGDGRTPLMAATRLGNDDVLLLLLQKGANVNAVDDEGNNALHSAVAAHYTTESIRILLEYGIEVNHQNNAAFPAPALADLSHLRKHQTWRIMDHMRNGSVPHPKPGHLG